MVGLEVLLVWIPLVSAQRFVVSGSVVVEVEVRRDEGRRGRENICWE